MEFVCLFIYIFIYFISKRLNYHETLTFKSVNETLKRDRTDTV